MPQLRCHDRHLPLVLLTPCILKLLCLTPQHSRKPGSFLKMEASPWLCVSYKHFPFLSEFMNITNEDNLNIKITFISHAIRNLLQLKTKRALKVLLKQIMQTKGKEGVKGQIMPGGPGTSRGTADFPPFTTALLRPMAVSESCRCLARCVLASLLEGNPPGTVDREKTNVYSPLSWGQVGIQSYLGDRCQHLPEEGRRGKVKYRPKEEAATCGWGRGPRLPGREMPGVRQTEWVLATGTDLRTGNWGCRCRGPLQVGA